MLAPYRSPVRCAGLFWHCGAAPKAAAGFCGPPCRSGAWAGRPSSRRRPAAYRPASRRGWPRRSFPGRVGHILAERVICDQFDHAGFRLEGVDDSLGDPRHPHDDRFNLGQFDAIPADLHLRVEPAEILDLAVFRDAAEVAGPVDPGRGIVGKPKKVRMKAFSVRSGRLTYPTASPMPAMQISPISLSPPAGMLPAPGSKPVRWQRHADGDGLIGASSVQVAVTVASVGP